jgi:hypothetical protein
MSSIIHTRKKVFTRFTWKYDTRNLAKKNIIITLPMYMTRKVAYPSAQSVERVIKPEQQFRIRQPTFAKSRFDETLFCSLLIIIAIDTNGSAAPTI